MAKTMEELETVALACLRDRNSVPIRCGTLGDQIFRDHIKETGMHNGSAPYARITGKIMARLKENGLAYYTGRGSYFGWVISQKGLALIESGEPDVKS